MAISVDVNQLANQLKEALGPLADKLGKSAEVVYSMAVKDALITGHNLKVGVCLMAFGFVCSVIIFFIGIGKDSEAASMLGFVGMGISALLLMMFYPDMTHHLQNPEYMALKDLLKSVR